MQPNATIIENLPDAMAFLQEMETQEIEIYGGFRPLARRATAEIIEKAMHDAVDKHCRPLRSDSLPVFHASLLDNKTLNPGVRLNISQNPQLLPPGSPT